MQLKLAYLLCFTFVFLCGCGTKPVIVSELASSNTCREQLAFTKTKDIQFQLNSLSVLFDRGCYEEVKTLGTNIRNLNRDKYYSLTKEISEVVVYEGFAKEYVLDSHERIFLSLLISMSYLKQGNTVGAEVELNKAYEESTAQIYSSGTDELNVFFQGLLWLRVSGPEKAMPFFKKIEKDETYNRALKMYTQKIINSVDKHQKVAFSILTINKMPNIEFDWFSTYSEKYQTHPRIKNCISETGVLLTTQPWVEKIKQRDQPEQDPVLNYKRVLRLPMATLYSTMVLLIGSGLTYASAKVDPQLAAAFLLMTIAATRRTFVNSLAPDMRNWYELPEAFYISNQTANLNNEVCFKSYDTHRYKVKDFIDL